MSFCYKRGNLLFKIKKSLERAVEKMRCNDLEKIEKVSGLNADERQSN